MAGALEGLRVLDFSHAILGPSCTAILADHGADVIKVERPGQGEVTRAFGPFFEGESLPYVGLNRNKRSLAVDLKTAEGRDVIFRLIPSMDVLVSNFRPGVLESLGLGYEEVRRQNPRLIYAVGSGYGQSGPYAERRKAGHETMAQALSGVAQANADRGGIPRPVPVPIADISGGNLMVQGILLALVARERTGRGQRVEVALLDGMVWLQGWFVARPADSNSIGPREDQNPLSGGVYRTQDGYVIITHVFRPNPLREVCAALGIDDLSPDPRFASAAAMAKHGDELRSVLQARLLEKATAEWVRILETADIMCAPVQSLDVAIEDPQVLHNEMIVDLDHPPHGRIKIAGVPVKLSETPGRVRTPAPSIGQDTVGILAQFGYSEAEIAELRRRGIVAGGEPVATGGG
jgi:crotonobetainyl-CoA:carnitine CoA-transferase CaiB-like acyl-CoA transferase